MGSPGRPLMGGPGHCWKVLRGQVLYTVDASLSASRSRGLASDVFGRASGSLFSSWSQS